MKICVLTVAVLVFFGVLSVEVGNCQTTFFLGPGDNPIGDIAFQTAAGSFQEVDFEGFTKGEMVSSLVLGSQSIEFSPSIVFDISEFGSGPPAGQGNGTVEGNTINNSPEITFTFSPPVKGFGSWIFDDGATSAETFRMTVVEVGGATSVSDVLDSGNLKAHAVEGFLGAVSNNGIEQATIRVSGIAGFELDNIQFSPLPEPSSSGSAAIIALLFYLQRRSR